MQKQTIIAIGVALVLVGGICLATGLVAGVLVARLGDVRPRPSSIPRPPSIPADSGSSRAPAPAPLSPRGATEPWETRTAALGVTVSVPRSWKVEADPATGQVRLVGPHAEEVLAWPVFVGSPLDAAGARNLVSTLAEKLVTRVQWALPDSPAPGVARSRGLSGRGFPAVALFSWASGPEGSAGQVFLAISGDDAPLDEAVTSKILASFHAAGSPASASAGRATPSLAYVRWTDPNENAFSVEVPRGWKVEGGLRRLAPTDVRGEIDITSPDGLVRVTAGDFEIPTFSEPTRMGVQLGFAEGTWYAPSGTQRFMIRRYKTGLEFGRDYVKQKVAQFVGGLELVKERERPDLVGVLNRQLEQSAVPGQTAHATAAETAFQGQLGGQPCVGSYFVGTQRTTMQVVGLEPISLWNVVILDGFAATKDKTGLAASVLDHLVQSFEYTPQWVNMQQNITMESARIVHETGVDVSKKIADSYWQRSAGESELSRRRSNATLGVEDVTDPTSGRAYKVESGSNYYWLDDRGNLVGTDTPGAPSIDFRELVRQP